MENLPIHKELPSYGEKLINDYDMGWLNKTASRCEKRYVPSHSLGRFSALP